MPKRKKKAQEQTTEEAINRLFPKPLVKKLKEVASADKPKKQKVK